MSRHRNTEFDDARDELMSHIHRCGVLKASVEQQDQWLAETMEFIAERYASLSDEQVQELRDIGQRFCQPVIPHGKDHTALTQDDEDSTNNPEQGEMVGAA